VASWLEAHGLRVLARNWRCPYGEIDVIAEDAGELVFVEVKTRRGTALGAPEKVITLRKCRPPDRRSTGLHRRASRS
jgi:putative endonuclease